MMAVIVTVIADRVNIDCWPLWIDYETRNMYARPCMNDMNANGLSDNTNTRYDASND